MGLQGRSLEKFIRDKFDSSVKELLTDWYWNKGMTQKEIAKALGVTNACICMNFKKFAIEQKKHNWWFEGFKHTEETKEKISNSQKGKHVSLETRKKLSIARKGHRLVGRYENFKGIRTRSDGYVQKYVPDHPFCTSDGYVMEHRLVMESHINRYLLPDEEVHHINGDKKDNRISNLHLFASKRDHMRFHMSERHGKTEELKYEYK